MLGIQNSVVKQNTNGIHIMCNFQNNTLVIMQITAYLIPEAKRPKVKKKWNLGTKIVCEYDQVIPQLQTANKPMAPQGRATQQSRDTRTTN